MKKIVQDIEQKEKNLVENRHRLDNVIALAFTKFDDEGIMEDMFPEAKVIQLGEIAIDLRKKVAKHEKQVKPGTPPQVLEEIMEETIEAMPKIEEGEAICSNIVDQVIQSWGELMDDVESEKI